MQQIGSGQNGLGIGSFGLDWSTVAGFFGSPLATPSMAIFNIMISLFLIIYVLLPITYWTNTYDAKRFPMISSNVLTVLETSQWWFQVLLVSILGLSIFTCLGFNRQLQLPWWGLFFACGMAFLFTLPFGVIQATTNQVCCPGKPLANVTFKTYGSISVNHALTLLSDLNLGKYMKIPPKSMFIVQAGKGGELTHDETTIIAGALELTEKNAKDAMTPLSETFAIDINAKISRDLIRVIMKKGHSRVPVYYNQHTNIVGLILVKDMLDINPADEVPVRSVTIRKILRVKEDMPLYDILNEFQKGYSHMAVVVRVTNPTEQPNNNVDNELRLDIDAEQPKLEKKLTPMVAKLHQWKSCPSGSGNLNRGRSIRGTNKKRLRDNFGDVLHINGGAVLEVNDDEAIGIITMEDVIEELLQEEIYDETDMHEDL